MVGAYFLKLRVCFLNDIWVKFRGRQTSLQVWEKIIIAGGPNLKNTGGGEAIRTSIQSIWSSFKLVYVPVHCLDERGFFYVPNVVVYPSLEYQTDPIIPCNIEQ